MLLKKKIFLYYLVLFFASFFCNQYYAYIGVLPIDSFLTFNTGYDLLNGVLPFRDVWTIKGPTLDLIQAFLFKMMGISWLSYATHASIFNSLFALSTFWTLKKFNLDIKFCFLYSILASLLMYPTYGIPFTDHHVSILSLISLYCLILAIRTDENIYWFLIPIFLFLAFFSKQVPAGYFLILISIISIVYLIFNFKSQKIIYGFTGSILVILIFFILIYLFDIPFQAFIDQYILFPISLGETRIEWVFPLEFKRFVWRYKLHYIALAIPIFIFIKNSSKNFKNIYHNESLIIICLIGSLIIFVFHQLMTINGLFIYFLIPVFCGFSHVFVLKYFSSKKYMINFLIIISLFSTIYYHSKYISKRDTLRLRNVDLEKSIDASVLDNKLKNLKWITYHYPENPQKEISNLIEAIDIIKKDQRTKMIVTDYQFISVILSINDNAPTRFWWRHHGYPDEKNKYFNVWKNFLKQKIRQNNIKVIYTVKPLEGERDILENILSKKCFTMLSLTNILDIQILEGCDELKN